MCFLRNGSPYSFGTCTFAIYIPENLRVHCIWPSKYKGKWCFSPKCVFSETDHHTALKLVPLQLTFLWTSGCTEFDPLNTKESDVLAQNLFFEKWVIIQPWNLYHCDWHARKPQGALSCGPLNTKESDCFSPKCVFSETDHHTALKLIPLQLTFLWTSGCTEFGPSKYKGKWCFSPKFGFFFSETGHHTALKLVPLQLTFLWTSGCTEFGPLNTKESDVLAQNLFFSEMGHHTALKLVQLWLACQKTSGCTEFGPLNTKESDVLAQNVFSQKWIIIQFWNLYHCDWHAWKLQSALNLAL